MSILFLIKRKHPEPNIQIFDLFGREKVQKNNISPLLSSRRNLDTNIWKENQKQEV